MKKRVKRFNRRDNRNRTIIIGLIILILIVIVIYFIVKNILGNVITGNAITGLAVSDSPKINASKISIALGSQCQKNVNAGIIYLGKSNNKDYSSVIQFDISSYIGKPVQSAEVCFDKYGNNPVVEFEVYLKKESSLNCPSSNADEKIITTRLSDIKNNHYYCFDVKDYLVDLLSSGQSTMFISFSGKKVSRLGVNAINFYGITANKKPYLKVELIPCTPDWSCGEWSQCSNDFQTRTCTDNNKCGVNPDISLIQQACFDPKDCSMSGVGVYDPSTSTFYLKNKLKAGEPDNIFKFGNKFGVHYSNQKKPLGKDWAIKQNPLYPIIGDWNGDKVDTVGYFDEKELKFYLKNSNSAGNADIVFKISDITALPSVIGQPQLLIPFAGDWDGDSKDGVALYNPLSGEVLYKNSLQDGKSDKIENWYHIFMPYQNTEPDYKVPIAAGDFNGDGKDELLDRNSYIDLYDYSYTINSLYQPEYQLTYRNHWNRPYTIDISYGGYPSQHGVYTSYIAGDWNNDGQDEIGVYNTDANNNKKGAATFYLNSNLNSNNDFLTFPFAENIGNDIIREVRYSNQNAFTKITIKNAFKLSLSGNWQGCKRIVNCSDCSYKEPVTSGRNFCGDSGNVYKLNSWGGAYYDVVPIRSCSSKTCRNGNCI